MSLDFPSCIVGGAVAVGLLLALRSWGVRTMQVDMLAHARTARVLAEREALALESSRAPRLKRMDAEQVARYAEYGAAARARGLS